MKKINIGIIGGGNMGRAIAIALTQCENFAISVSNPHIDKIKHLKKFGISLTSKNIDVVLKADVVILAVKPNLIEAVSTEIKPYLNSKKLLISVAAGILINQLAIWSGNKKIVRCMPNTPVQVRLGFTAWSSKNLNSEDKNLVKSIFASVGQEMELKKEEQIDDIGTLTGCGPAYVFYFMEAMQRSAEKYGFTKKEAHDIAFATFNGSIKLAQESTEDFAQLRANVTSKGGVTHAAISHLEEMKFKTLFHQAALKAKKRTSELRGS